MRHRKSDIIPVLYGGNNIILSVHNLSNCDSIEKNLWLLVGSGDCVSEKMCLSDRRRQNPELRASIDAHIGF